MSRKMIAIDIDDVLASERETIRNFINKNYGTHHTTEDYSTEGPYWGYWEHVWQVSDDEARERFAAYLASGQHAEMQVTDGAIDAVTRLQVVYDLTVVTSRMDTLIDITQDWLSRTFPEAFKRVEFVAAWDNNTVKASKAVICEAIGAAYLIDDNMDHCNLAAEAGITALLFGDYGWNRTGALHKKVTKVKTWKAVEEYFGI